MKHFNVQYRVAMILAYSAIMVTLCHANQGSYRTYKDIAYATVDGKKLCLDLYMPMEIKSPLLVVWIHGGAWRSGSKADVPLGFVRFGFATASIDYRLSEEARFPIQIYDIKAAIRFLRAMSQKYGYKTKHIAVAGSSAGGHLAALVGTTNGNTELEGKIGDCLDQSSDVQAIVDYFGPTDFMTILPQSTPHGLSVRVPALDLLLGGQPEDLPDLAKLASPITHVDANDPPLLMLHGDQDPQVPINQSLELQGAYERFGLDVSLDVVHGSAHGGDAFFDPHHLKEVAAFLHRVLEDSPVQPIVHEN